MSRFLLTVILSVFLTDYISAQSFRIESETDDYYIYKLTNDSLSKSRPFELTIFGEKSSIPFQILEQKVIQQHSPITNGESSILKPLVEMVGDGFVKKKPVSRLHIHVSRRQGSIEYITQHLLLKVRKIESRTFKKAQSFKSQSIQDHPLSTGNWVKIEFEHQGIHSISPDELSDADFDLSTIDPKKIQLWGFDGKELNHRNSEMYQTFRQIPILVEGEDDGSFSGSDRIYFYGNTGNLVTREEVNGNYEFGHTIHHYSNYGYLFLTVGNENGLRMQVNNDGLTPLNRITTFTDLIWKEDELFKSEDELKSGRDWLGQIFSPENFANQQTILLDTIPGFVNGSQIDVRIRYYARATLNSVFKTTVNDQNLSDAFITRVSSFTSAVGNSANYRDLIHTLNDVNLTDNILELQAEYINNSSGATGWVDFIELEVTRNLTAENGKLQFFPPSGLGTNSAYRFEMNGFDSAPITIDATDPYEPKLLTVNHSGNQADLIYYSRPLNRIIAQNTFHKARRITKISNQNISGVSTFPDYIIITIPSYLDEANRLAEFRRQNDGFETLVVTQEQVFNEFSGGIPDVMATRNMLKHFYDAATSDDDLPQYLLLFGDTSFDYKNIQTDVQITNDVFTYQTSQSINRVFSYSSDDFFGLLDDTEGTWTSTTNELLDIGIGRLPVNSSSEARIVVDKIIHYEISTNSFGDWRNLYTFAADDDFPSPAENRDLHVLNADSTAAIIDREASGIKLKKIYLFDYPVENTAGGRRIPQATQDLINTINSGTLVVNYSGHGAEQILSDERFFVAEQIQELDNYDRLTIFVTATCSFGRFDDNQAQSGAELLVLHENGGAVASLTTTRVVYTSRDPNSNNFGLNRVLTQIMSTRDLNSNLPKRLGDIYQQTKVTGSVGPSVNSRKFILIGDPATRIKMPERKINLTQINSSPIESSGVIDVNALEEIELQGSVLNTDELTDISFNGEVAVQIVDTRRFVNLPNDRWNCYMPDCGYFYQNDILFNGRATVTNGQFNAKFILPKNVNFSGGTSRIMVYVNDGVTDGTGSFNRMRVTGLGNSLVNDNTGPNLQVYINDQTFMNGNIVNQEPTLVVQIDDPVGLNTAATGVGQEMIANIIKPDLTRETIVLNEYFTSDLNDFKKGEARYTFESLPEGDYSLDVRAWDIFNNPSDEVITFQVTNSSELIIKNVYNFPNPMHSKTQFFIEHNQPNNAIDIQIKLYTLSGRLIQVLENDNVVTTSPYISVDWNGRDRDGDRIATGTYLYHVLIKAETATGRKKSEHIEKLVLIN